MCLAFVLAKQIVVAPNIIKHFHSYQLLVALIRHTAANNVAGLLPLVLIRNSNRLR